MFNFQKEVVLNSVDPAKMKVTEGAVGAKVRFHDGGEYFARYMVAGSGYKTKANPGKIFDLTINAGDLVSKHVQILVELGLDNDYRGDYGSALFYFRKPLLVDVVLPAEAADAAKVIYEAFKKAVPAEYKFVTFEDKQEGEAVKISGADSYQKVRKVVITDYICDPGCEETPEVELVNLSGKDLVAGNSTVEYTANEAEFGTYEYLLHNLRLPTYENYRFMSPNASEMPVRGTNYTQYTFAYCVPRVGLGGLSAVGQTIHSTTLHTFFVNEECESDFEGLFTDFEFEFKEIVPGDEEGHKVVVVSDKNASVADLIDEQ